MQALVNAFMRCLFFLLPPSWLCVSFCLWVGNDCEETLPRSNPRARFKSRKPLTYEEVAAAVQAHGGCSPSVSPAPGCVSLAATSPAAPQGPPAGRNWIGGLWRAVERILGAPWIFLRHRWCPKTRRAAVRAPYPACAFSSRQIRSFQGGAAAAEDGTEPGGATLTRAENMSATAEMPGLSPAECASDAEQGVDEVITVEQLSQEMGTVTITVAIQAAEDEEPEEVSSNNLDFLGASCSEDEYGRHDKSRYGGGGRCLLILFREALYEGMRVNTQEQPTSAWKSEQIARKSCHCGKYESILCVTKLLNQIWLRFFCQFMKGSLSCRCSTMI